MNPVVRMIVDLEMRSGVDTHLKWIRSEDMIADKASRPDIDPFQVMFRDECSRAVKTFVREGPVIPKTRVGLDWDDAHRQFLQ